MRGRILFGGSVLLAALVFALVAFGRHTTNRPPAASGPFESASALPSGLAGRPAPGFALRDAAGGGVLRSSALAGRPYAVTFLYTHCPDVCPLIGEEIHSALSDLGRQAAQMTIIGISVDPRGDTAGTVRAWLALHREPANFHYLIGSEATLAPVWKGYYASPQIPGDPNSSHTAAIWLINRHGKRAALIDAGVSIVPGKLAHDFHVLMKET